MPSVRVCPQIAIAAMNQRRDRSLRIWDLARHLDINGRGIVEVDSLEVPFGKDTLRRAIDAGDGLFWHKRQHKGTQLLDLRSPDNVANDLEAVARHWVDVPLDSYSSMGKLRGAYLKAFLATGRNGQMTISQSTLARMVGRSRQTVSHYLFGVKRQANAMQSERQPGTLTGEMQNSGWFIAKQRGQIIVCRRLPSTYFTRLDSRRRKHRCSNPSFTGEWVRLFCESAGRKTVKALQQLREGATLFVKDSGHTRGGVRLWHGWQRVNGLVGPC